MKTSFLIIGLIFFSSFFIADNIQAQVQLTDYKLLEPLPFITDGPNSNTTNAEIYIPGLINLAIAVAGAAAVLRIIYGGFLYISSDAINKKKEGIGVIKETLWGLFFVLSAWAIVYTLRDGTDGKIEFNLNLPTKELKANENSPQPQSGIPMSPEELEADSIVRDRLTGANIAINNGPCAQGQAYNCTNLNGLPEGRIQALVTLKSDCGCELVITGGTEELAHVSHGPGLDPVDLRDTTTLRQWMSSKGYMIGNDRAVVKLSNGRQLIMIFEPAGGRSTGAHWHVK